MNSPLSRSLPLSLLLFTLSACATIPVPGRGIVNPPSLRPVKPLMEGRGNAIVVSKDSKNPTDRIKLETPNPKSGKPAQSSTKSLSTTELKAKLQDAEDKSASARSLSQSAQTPEDWQLVVQRWQKSIDILKPLSTQNTAISTQIQQVLTDARIGQARAQQEAEGLAKGSSTPLQVDRSKSGKSQGLIYGDIPSPSPSPSKAPTVNPTQNPTQNPPSPKN
jgi:hypothetical protein